MITTKLMGGLGNYLFQIAVTYSLAIDNHDIAMFDFNKSVQVHKNINQYSANIFSRVLIGEPDIKSRYFEPNFSFDKLEYMNNTQYNGYFQSEKYFKHNRSEILKLFTATDEIDEYITKKYGELLNNKTCSIHVRRGDYLTLSDYHPVCDITYYNEAMNIISDNCEIFLVFSDDIKWCKENFIGDNFIFITDETDIIDLYLMSRCNHNIIANSSFSWWGAWLNTNKNNIVVAPKQWFGISKPLDTSNIYCENWIKL